MRRGGRRCSRLRRKSRRRRPTGRLRHAVRSGSGRSRRSGRSWRSFLWDRSGPGGRCCCRSGGSACRFLRSPSSGVRRFCRRMTLPPCPGPSSACRPAGTRTFPISAFSHPRSGGWSSISTISMRRCPRHLKLISSVLSPALRFAAAAGAFRRNSGRRRYLTRRPSTEKPCRNSPRWGTWRYGTGTLTWNASWRRAARALPARVKCSSWRTQYGRRSRRTTSARSRS